MHILAYNRHLSVFEKMNDFDMTSSLALSKLLYTVLV